MGKILSREALKQEIDRLKGEGKKIAFTNGCFDILHVVMCGICGMPGKRVMF